MYTFTQEVAENRFNTISIEIKYTHGEGTLNTYRTIEFVEENYQDKLSKFIVDFEKISENIIFYHSRMEELLFKEYTIEYQIKDTDILLFIDNDHLYDGVDYMPAMIDIKSIHFFDNTGLKHKLTPIKIADKIKEF